MHSNNVVPIVADTDENSLPFLLATFKRLCDQHLNDQNIENQKLAIIQRIQNQLNQKIVIPAIVSTPDLEEQTSALQQALRNLAYQFCMTFSFFEKAAGSFLFGSNLFTLIPGVSHPTLLFLTGIYALLDALLFYAFEISFLKETLGVVLPESDDCLLNKTYQQQLESTIEINIFLHRSEIWDWDATSRDQYMECMHVFNQNLIHKHTMMHEYKRSIWKRGLEYCVITIGALSSVADSYFIAKSILLALHISFMTSPIAWALVISMTVSSIVLCYAMSVESVSKLIHPDMESYHALQKSLTFFKHKHENDLVYIPEKYRIEDNTSLSFAQVN